MFITFGDLAAACFPLTHVSLACLGQRALLRVFSLPGPLAQERNVSLGMRVLIQTQASQLTGCVISDKQLRLAGRPCEDNRSSTGWVRNKEVGSAQGLALRSHLQSSVSTSPLPAPLLNEFRTGSLEDVYPLSP